MAVSFVNSPVEVLASTSGAGAATLGMTAPGSPVSGDIWIAQGFVNSAGAGMTMTDWTIIEAVTDFTSSTGSMWWHRYAGSTPNLDLSITGSGAGSACMGTVTAFRGCLASGNPISDSSINAGASSSTIAHNTVTPGSAGGALLIANMQRANQNRTALGGDYQVAYSDGGNAFQATSRSMSLFYDLDVPASATGTINVTSGGNGVYLAYQIALTAEPTGHPAAKRMGGVPYSVRATRGMKMWRESLSGLLVPDRKLVRGYAL